MCMQVFVHTKDTDKEGVYVLQDDAALLKMITNKLATLPGCTTPEAELKVYFGFRLVAGHRYWRKLKTALLSKGCIMECEASLNVCFQSYPVIVF